MVDVVLGDPAFDGDFLVEAAPAVVVKQLLDAPTRRFLEARGPSVHLLARSRDAGDSVFAKGFSHLQP